MREKKKDFAEIGKRIQDARKDAGFTQEQLAEAIGVTPQYLSDLERGIVGTSVQTLVKICSTLHVSSDFLLFGQARSAAYNPLLLERLQQLPEERQHLLHQYLNLLLETDPRPNEK